MVERLYGFQENYISTYDMGLVLFFFEKYMPHSMHKHLRNLFIGLEKGSVIIVEYKVRFYELARHATMILPSILSEG